MNRCVKYILLSLMTALSIALAGCSNHVARDIDTGTAVLYLSVRAAATSINTDEVLWEDRVDELRMIAFDRSGGSVAFNQKLYFPDGFSSSSRPVEIRPGEYDLYFFANETVDAAFTAALMDISNLADFSTDPRFTAIAYDPGFTPDGTTADGRFLMSAVYEGITIQSGGTYNNPLPLALPTTRVELIRAMAKVEVVFRKKVAGSNVPDNTITSVEMENVAANMSVPPVDGYYGGTLTETNYAALDGFDYGRDSIGSVVFYIPEFLVPAGGTTSPELVINNTAFPIETDGARGGLAEQRRTVPAISDNSVIRNYHYIVNVYINAEGGLQLLVDVQPWKRSGWLYIFQGDNQIVVPPVEPTDSSIIFPTDCGKIELLSENEYLPQGLQGTYNDEVEYYDPVLQGPTIIRGEPPYYCEKKYGPGWRLINSCELLSFLYYFDQAYNIWTSNTWEADTWNMPYYPLEFRQEAQFLLEKLTGEDLSATVLYDTNNFADQITDWKLNVVDDYFTPGDIVVKEDDYPGGWPFPSPPGTTASESWYYNEVVIQVNVYWYGDSYVSYSNKANWDEILYGHFVRYDYSSTVSRCVRNVD